MRSNQCALYARLNSRCVNGKSIGKPARFSWRASSRSVTFVEFFILVSMIEKASDQKNRDASAQLPRQCRADLREMLHRPRAPDRAMKFHPAHPVFGSLIKQLSARPSGQNCSSWKIKPVALCIPVFAASNHSSKRELRQISDRNENKSGRTWSIVADLRNRREHEATIDLCGLTRDTASRSWLRSLRVCVSRRSEFWIKANASIAAIRAA
jgi:hypothetical protein